MIVADVCRVLPHPSNGISTPRTSFLVKLIDYAKVGDDTAEPCRFYARWLGSPLEERLRAEMRQLLEEVIMWCGRRMIYDEMGRRSPTGGKCRPHICVRPRPLRLGEKSPIWNIITLWLLT